MKTLVTSSEYTMLGFDGVSEMWRHRIPILDFNVETACCACGVLAPEKNGANAPHYKSIIVKPENMLTVHQWTKPLPPLARIVSSPSRECINNYGLYYKIFTNNEDRESNEDICNIFCRNHSQALTNYLTSQTHATHSVT